MFTTAQMNQGPWGHYDCYLLLFSWKIKKKNRAKRNHNLFDFLPTCCIYPVAAAIPQLISDVLAYNKRKVIHLICYHCSWWWSKYIPELLECSLLDKGEYTVIFLKFNFSFCKEVFFGLKMFSLYFCWSGILLLITFLNTFYLQEYGSLENSPEFITGQILEMDALSQSEVSQELKSWKNSGSWKLSGCFVLLYLSNYHWSNVVKSM